MKTSIEFKECRELAEKALAYGVSHTSDAFDVAADEFVKAVEKDLSVYVLCSVDAAQEVITNGGFDRCIARHLPNGQSVLVVCTDTTHIHAIGPFVGIAISIRRAITLLLENKQYVGMVINPSDSPRCFNVSRRLLFAIFPNLKAKYGE